jgi:hypothetical protein
MAVIARREWGSSALSTAGIVGRRFVSDCGLMPGSRGGKDQRTAVAIDGTRSAI